ncbi:MAG: hypothetical protein JF597_47885, partial [Streptomyces sp.]|uniref:hypothetical protein n=1 Tax=Streptomyces sp. TaxID=1931 RepID=UPI0025EBA436
MLALGVGTASAAGISSPDDGTTYSSPTTVSVSASFAGCAALATSCPSGSLTVDDPTGARVGSTSKTASRGTSSTPLSLSVGTGDATSRPNGAWTVTLKSGSSTTTTHYYTNMPAATPTGFSAIASDGDPHDVFLSWTKGAEPDLQGYTLYDGNGAVVQSGITPTSACSGSSCHFALYYDNPKPGTYTYTYALSASRGGGCAAGDCPDVESSKTSTQTASLTTPAPPPSPTPAPGAGGGTTGGGSSGGSPGGTSSGGSTGGSSSGGT